MEQSWGKVLDFSTFILFLVRFSTGVVGPQDMMKMKMKRQISCLPCSDYVTTWSLAVNRRGIFSIRPRKRRNQLFLSTFDQKPTSFFFRFRWNSSQGTTHLLRLLLFLCSTFLPLAPLQRYNATLSRNMPISVSSCCPHRGFPAETAF